MRVFYLRWLKVSSIITIFFGLVVSFASSPKTQQIWLKLFDLIKWPIDNNPSGFSFEEHVLNAVLGGVMSGWGLMMYLLSQNDIYNYKIGKIIFSSLLCWFFIDSIGSYFAELPVNIFLNTLFLLMFAIPLLGLKRIDS